MHCSITLWYEIPAYNWEIIRNFFFSLQNYSGHRIAIINCLFIINLINSLIYLLVQYSGLLKIRVGLIVNRSGIYGCNMLFRSVLSHICKYL